MNTTTNSLLVQKMTQLSPAKRKLLLQRLARKEAGDAGDGVRRIPRDGNPFPLSYGQERFWYLHQLDPDPAAEVIFNVVQLQGKLDLAALRRSLGAMVSRHESLRTFFQERAEGPVQVVTPAVSVELPVVSLACLSQRHQLRELERWVRYCVKLPFNLSRAPLLRLMLLPLGEDLHVFVRIVHHIISDGWSEAIFYRELVVCYNAITNNRPLRLPAMPVQYVDYTLWQRRPAARRLYDAQLAYWRRQLAGAEMLLNLPVDRPRPPVQTFTSGLITAQLPQSLQVALAALGRNASSTLFMILAAAVSVLIAKWAGRHDVLVATPVANRNRSEVENVIGFFVNTLVLRMDLSGNPTFREFLARTGKMILQAQDHQDVPFEAVAREVHPQRVDSHNPVYQTMFVLQPPMAPEESFHGLTFFPLEIAANATECDLMVAAEQREGRLAILVFYNVDLFVPTSIRRFLRQFECLLHGVVADSECRLAELPLLNPAERHQLLVEWNDSAHTPPHLRQPFHRLFERQATRTPEAIAAVFGSEVVTYRELDRRAGQLASHLVGYGAGPETVAALLTERSIDLLAVVVAVFKTGGAYLPLEPHQPAQRHREVLQRSGATVALVTRELLPKLAEVTAELGDEAPRTLIIEDLLATPGKTSKPFCTPPSSLCHGLLAYVIYTSGSTGVPKGAMVVQGGMVNHLWAKIRDLELGPEDRVAQTASQCFDISVWQMLAALLVGGRVHLYPDEVASDPIRLLSRVREDEISILEVVPSLMRMMLPEVAEDQGTGSFLPHLRWLIPTGEALPPELCRRWHQIHPRIPLVNAYGPTECSDDVSHHPIFSTVPEGFAIPIGRPVINMALHVLDPHLNPNPIGVPGELCAAGAGVGRGYLRDPGRTAEVFVPHPFARGGRLYRTGDLARFLADGTIEFLGRIDHQVKIRGFRIELGEIESLLDQHPQVRAAVVVTQQDRRGDARLLACVVPTTDDLSTDALRDALRQRLPDYMLPAAFVVLDELPLTPNGKIDRKALSARVPGAEEWSLQHTCYVAPQTPTEELLAGIWADVLGLDRVGREDDFFGLGGHSLLATQLISRVRLTFQVELPLRALFEAPTVADLAGRVENARSRHLRSSVPPLERAPRRRDSELPLSFAQERLWLIHRMQPDSPAYNMPGAVRLQGNLDRSRLLLAVNGIVRRHEVLRTNFADIGGRPVQLVASAARLELPVADLAGLKPNARELQLRRLTSGEASRPFDLSHDPLIRIRLIRLAEADHLLVFNMHHIASDGWSIGILVRELLAFYHDEELSPLPVQYGDFAVWQRRWLSGEVLEEEFSWWQRQLQGAPHILELPTDRPRPPVRSHRGATLPMSLSPALTGELKKLSRQQGTTLFMALLATFQVLLYRHAQQEDLLVGSPIAGRNRVEIENLIGFFVNTLVLRADFRGRASQSFEQLLTQVRQVALDAYAHQDLPFERLVEKLQPQRNMSIPPLFQVMFVLQNAPQVPLAAPDLRITPYPVAIATAKFDLTMALEESDGGIVGGLEFNADLFDPTTIKRLDHHFRLLVAAMVADPKQRLAEASLMSAAERHQVVVEWRGMRTDYPRGRTIQEIFEAVAAARPQAPAVIGGRSEAPEVLSYRELNERANRLARHLRELGVGAPRSPVESLVGLAVERSVHLAIGALAILKAGGAYVPLDRSYPEQRLAFILGDTGVRVVLVDRTGRESMAKIRGGPGIQLVDLDHDREVIRRYSSGNLPCPVGPENLAYVVYTSGSTGRPKGVAVMHRSVVRLVCETNYATLDSRQVFLQFAPVAFDASTLEIWGPLLNGGVLAIYPEARASLAELAAAIARHGTSTLFLTTGLFNQMVEDHPEGLRSVRQLLTGGEVMSPPHLAKALAELPEVVLTNVYGPTENTTFTSFHPLRRAGSPGASIPIGRPIANTSIAILDRDLQPGPIGVAGELSTGGDGLARGYLHRSRLTAEKFMPDPLGESGERLYRTGDLGLWRSDGTVEFLGRRDRQVKLRGFRIEPGEIEAALNAHPAVAESVVVVRGQSPNDRRLVAYLVAATERTPEPRALRDFLHDALPDYMVPSAFVFLDEMPLTPNGKVDRAALPEPDRIDAEKDFQAPRNPTEELVAGIWTRVLELDDGVVGVDDDFFELGGHSLLATRVVSHLRELFQVELPLQRLFEAPTVAELSVHVDVLRREGRGVELPPIVPVARNRPLPASFGQERLWFLDRLGFASGVYNVPVVVRLRGVVGTARLARVFNRIAERHEVLRTHFVAIAGRPHQVIARHLHVPLPVVDLQPLTATDREAESQRLAAAEARRLFDLGRRPLIRFTLLRQAPAHHVMLVTMHHIISDGWSMGVLLREFAAIYADRESELPELRLQYADFAHWQRQWLVGEVLEVQLAYWRRQLADAPQRLPLATDRPRPAIQKFHGRDLPFNVSASSSGALVALSRRHGATLFMTLLAAFKVLLHRYTGEHDLVVGTPIAGRNHEAIEGLIGFFVNTLMLRTDLSGRPSFERLLAQVRAAALDAYAHQDVPFERLVEELRPQRDLSITPLFQVLFALHNAPQATFDVPELTVVPLPVAGETTKFELSLSLQEGESGMSGSLTYSTDLFDHTTIVRFGAHFQRLLAGIVEDPRRRIGELPLLSAAESHQLLVAWNDSRSAGAELTPLVHQQIAVRATANPEAVAVVNCRPGVVEQLLTYGELDQRANRLAQRLRQLGVGPEVAVAVALERGSEMIVGLLAILKAGGAYLVLDPADPPQRLRFMIEDSGVSVLLTQPQMRASLPAGVPSGIEVIAQWDRAPARPAPAPDSGVGAANLAYVIYTSGSTGRPKAVMVSHGNLTDYLSWVDRDLFGTGHGTLPLVASIAFDAALKQLWAPLLRGAPIRVLAPEIIADAAALLAAFDAGGHEILNCVPALWETLVTAMESAIAAAPRSLRQLWLSGEEVRADLVRRTRALMPALAIRNIYGPSEVTANASFAALPPGAAVTIGRPRANTHLRVTDGDLQPLPIGAVGELGIGGSGLARGYLRRPGLTAERFVPAPGRSPGERLYRTGDRVRCLADGRVEFLGRLDRQVKLRGFRIELGEIEATLADHPAVAEAVVEVRGEDPAKRRLVAYLVAKGQPPPTHKDLVEWLRCRLTDSMIPSVLTWLAALPRTASGKVNRAALPAPDASGQRDSGSVPPRHSVELQLVRIWQQLLNVEPVGVTDDFFDLGGHSLLAVRLLAHVREEFGRNLPLVTLFQHPTIEQLAGVLRRPDQPPVAWSPLVKIRSGAGGPAFFCVHAAGGGVLAYAALARKMDDRQAFYGLQAPGLEAGTEPLTRVEDMAACYIEAVRELQPQGPYFLGGWSVGAMVAFEMARRLQQQGQEVGLLAVIDMYAQNLVDTDEDHAELLVALLEPWLPLPAEELRGLDADDRVAYVLRRAREAWNLPASFGITDVQRILHQFKINIAARRAYSPQPYHGRIDLFRAREQPTGVPADPAMGWNDLAEQVEIHPVPGNHMSIVREPEVQFLARGLQACLSAAYTATERLNANGTEPTR